VTETSRLSFDPAWLALREPVDHRSRATELLEPLRAWWTNRSATDVLDLGCGTGSNLRYLAPRLPGASSWTSIDHDAALLARVRAPAGPFTVRAVRRSLSTARFDEAASAHLVTASALLDLVSERWLAALLDACAAAGSAALFALSYDGRVEWSGGPPDVEGGDALVTAAVNAHQRRDKGFGPALGPSAGQVAERLFRARGYTTWVRTSDWVLGPADAPLVDALVDGWAVAAIEERPADAQRVRGWAARRRCSEQERFTLRVGHEDVLALPPDPTSR
jgi:SAM-dependent methyltransferase